MNRIKVLNSTFKVKAVWVRVILKLQNFVNNSGFSFISPVTDHNGLYTAVMLRAISTPVQAITGHFIHESMGFHSPTLQLLTSDPANWRHYHQKPAHRLQIFLFLMVKMERGNEKQSGTWGTCDLPDWQSNAPHPTTVIVYLHG